jgi:hypothetical protein
LLIGYVVEPQHAAALPHIDDLFFQRAQIRQ